MKNDYANVNLFLLLMTCFTACQNNNDTDPPKKNEIKVTVVLAPGDTVKINASGEKVLMGCAFLVGGTFIQGTNENNAAVYINLIGSNCIVNPGKYSFLCEYKVNTANQDSPIYSNFISNTKGSITFTKIDGQYMEGFFDTICKCYSSGCAWGADTVIVKGSFKGNNFSN